MKVNTIKKFFNKIVKSENSISNNIFRISSLS